RREWGDVVGISWSGGGVVKGLWEWSNKVGGKSGGTGQGLNMGKTVVLFWYFTQLVPGVSED
nr:hypothetical protein [Tanacetum cinerariifolium]GFB83767.1 hypothetical protein [Tanacetum cinerariifolium]